MHLLLASALGRAYLVSIPQLSGLMRVLSESRRNSNNLRGLK